MSPKNDPHRREEWRRLKEQGRAARAEMQAIMDRVEARRLSRAEQDERRRRRIRRLLTLGLRS